MKNLKTMIAIFVLSFALYSCDSELSVDDPQTQNTEDVIIKTGEEGNETDDRGGD